jgi:hypothetical protein
MSDFRGDQACYRADRRGLVAIASCRSQICLFVSAAPPPLNNVLVIFSYMKILADERMSVKSEALQTNSGPPEDFIKLEQEGEPTEELFIGKL